MTRHINIVFWPPEAASILQPLELGIIQSFKVLYFKMVVKKCLYYLDKGKELKQTNLNLLVAMGYTAML